MDWETRDSVNQVLTFYNSKFNEGDWTCPTPPCVGVSRAAGGYLYFVNLKSERPPMGSANMTVTAGSGGNSYNSAVGVTKILLGWTPWALVASRLAGVEIGAVAIRIPTGIRETALLVL
jgi:hypothetical protein